MALEIPPLTSKDGTPAAVQNIRDQGRIQTHDEQVLEYLAKISNTLDKICTILEFEFDQYLEEMNNES